MDPAACAPAKSSLSDFGRPRFPARLRRTQSSRSALPSRSASLQRHRQRCPQLHPLSGSSQSHYRHQSLARQRPRGSGRHPALSREHLQLPARLSSSPYALSLAQHCPALPLSEQPVPFSRLSQDLAGLPVLATLSLSHFHAVLRARRPKVTNRKLSRNRLREAPEWHSKMPTKVNSLWLNPQLVIAFDSPHVLLEAGLRMRRAEKTGTVGSISPEQSVLCSPC